MCKKFIINVLFRDRKIESGPNLPIPLSFPCVQRINVTHIFIAGQSFANDTFPPLNGFIYDTINVEYIDVKANFIGCQRGYLANHSCTYLKNNNSIVMAFASCTLILNLNNLLWSEFPLPLRNGVIFNKDDMDYIVHYIAPYNSNMSKLYTASG